MKLSLKIFLLGLGLASTGIHLKAQDVKAFFDYAWFDQDNASAGDTTALVSHIKVKSCTTNADTTVIGHLHYWYQTQKTIANYGVNFYVSYDPQPGLIDTIYPGGILKNTDFICDTNFLEPRHSDTGPVNVIIIWPALIGPPSCDSGQYILPNILIDNPEIGIEEQAPEKFGSTVYPNPAEATQLVYINTKYTQQISQVTITNSMGQVLSTKEFTDAETSLGYMLPTHDLRAGIYHIHIYYRDNKNEVVRFIKN